MNPEKFITELSKHNFELSEKQIQQFNTYFKELITANEHVNLTRITAQDDVYLKHFYDSVTPLFYFKELFKGQMHLCDVGAGAGFPSIPLKILVPEIDVTIVDSLNKRLNFLDGLISKLDLNGVHLVHARAEDAGQNPAYREKFDVVSARAVANMTTLSEYCLPLVKESGYFLALKGPKADSELAESQKAIDILGAEVITKEELTLPNSQEERTLILLKKIKQTPKKYPRQAGMPGRKPIK